MLPYHDMMSFHLSLSLFLIFSVVSDSFPTGAPISACQTMMPGHTGVFPQPGPAPYIIKINSSSYHTGKPIKVQILGPAYRGLLLESRTFSQTTLFGQWLEPPNNTKILPCPDNPVGAITHSNTNIKDQSTTYIWMPPNSSCTTVLFFIATVAESFDVYWLGIRSAVIYNADSTEMCSISLSSSSATIQQAVVYLLVCFQIVIVVLVF